MSLATRTIPRAEQVGSPKRSNRLITAIEAIGLDPVAIEARELDGELGAARERSRRAILGRIFTHTYGIVSLPILTALKEGGSTSGCFALPRRSGRWWRKPDAQGRPRSTPAIFMRSCGPWSPWAGRRAVALREAMTCPMR